MNPGIAVLLEDVWKEYNIGSRKIVALRGVNLKILENQYVCITGPNGSGKSTLLKVIAGILKPDRGKVRVLDKDPFTEQSVKGIVGLMPQEDILFDSLSIIEHIELLSNINENVDYNYIHQIINRYGLSELLDRKPYQLSGGQRRLAQLVLVLSLRPKILLLDEPTAFLDSKNTMIILDFIQKLYENEKITIIMSTHDETVCSSSQKIIRIRDGLIIE